MEADGLEEGEIHIAGTAKANLCTVKHANDWGTNKENTDNYAGTPKRRKLQDAGTDRDSPMDTYIPPYANVSKVDSYVPEYKTRAEWMQILKGREKKLRTKMRSSQGSEEMNSNNDGTPKSGSETISDEHSSTFNNRSFMTRDSALLDEVSHDNIVWPAWLDPAGKFSQSISLAPEFQPFVQQKKILKQKQRAQLGDALQSIDVTNLKPSKAVLSGDGWKRDKDGVRLANIAWNFCHQQQQQQPTDPRIPQLLTL